MAGCCLLPPRRVVWLVGPPLVFYEYTEQGFSVFKHAVVAGVFEEEASGSPVRFEAGSQSDAQVRWRCVFPVLWGSFSLSASWLRIGGGGLGSEGQGTGDS